MRGHLKGARPAADALAVVAVDEVQLSDAVEAARAAQVVALAEDIPAVCAAFDAGRGNRFTVSGKRRDGGGRFQLWFGTRPDGERIGHLSGADGGAPLPVPDGWHRATDEELAADVAERAYLTELVGVDLTGPSTLCAVLDVIDPGTDSAAQPAVAEVVAQALAALDAPGSWLCEVWLGSPVRAEHNPDRARSERQRKLSREYESAVWELACAPTTHAVEAAREQINRARKARDFDAFVRAELDVYRHNAMRPNHHEALEGLDLNWPGGTGATGAGGPVAEGTAQEHWDTRVAELLARADACPPEPEACDVHDIDDDEDDDSETGGGPVMYVMGRRVRTAAAGTDSPFELIPLCKRAFAAAWDQGDLDVAAAMLARVVRVGGDRNVDGRNAADALWHLSLLRRDAPGALAAGEVALRSTGYDDLAAQRRISLDLLYIVDPSFTIALQAAARQITPQQWTRRGGDFAPGHPPVCTCPPAPPDLPLTLPAHLAVPATLAAPAPTAAC